MTKPHDCIVKQDENGKYRYVVINGKYYPAEAIEYTDEQVKAEELSNKAYKCMIADMKGRNNETANLTKGRMSQPVGGIRE